MRALLKCSVGKARVRIAHPLAVSAKAHAAQRREAYAVRGLQPKSAVDAWGAGMTFLLSSHQPLSLRYRRSAPYVPLRVLASPACRRVRRDSPRHGESLSFVASNESNQSKDALHSSQLRGYKGSACGRHAGDKPHTCCDFFTTRLAAHRLNLVRADAKRGVDRESLRSKRQHCSWGLSEPSRSAGLCGSVRSAPRNLTSRRLSERSERSERSEFGAAAKTEHRRAVGPRPTGEGGRLSFGSFSLAKQRKGTALSGAHPDAASRSEHGNDKARLRYLSPNVRAHANKASTSSARTAGRGGAPA